jgi:hypothetical protein
MAAIIDSGTVPDGGSSLTINQRAHRAFPLIDELRSIANDRIKKGLD